MSKYRYYITDTNQGLILGTNDVGMALQYAASDEYFVVDAAEGKMIDSDLESTDVINGDA